MEDSYREHSLQSQQDALDAEQSAYEETMNKFVQGMRESLEAATMDMDTFLGNVTTMVSLNAGAILEQYQQTGLPLSDALTNPWENAKTAVGDYDGDALALMNTWAQNGFLTEFPKTVEGSLTSPWKAGQTAVYAFKTSVDTQMKNVVAAIETNVKTASGKLSALYQQIEDTANKASKVVVTPTPSTPLDTDQNNEEPRKPNAPTILSVYGLTNKQVLDLGYGPLSLSGFENNLKNYKIVLIKDTNGKITGAIRPSEFLTERDKSLYNSGKISGPNAIIKYAKGTTGTDRDEWAITDESWIGEEITLAAGKTGHLRGMMKGSAVLPSSISENLIEWGKLSPDEMNSGGVVNNYVNAPTNDVDVENSLTIDGKSSNTQGVHDSIKDTYELIEDTVRNIDSISQNYKPSVDEALTTPWVDATEKVDEFNAAVNADYDDVVNHIDENKESLEIALNTPYVNVTGDVDDFSQHAQKASIDDVITHANEQNPALTTALSTGFNNAKVTTDAFKASGTSAVNAVKDSFTNAKTGLIKALNDTTAAAQKTKQAIDGVPTYSGGGGSSGASVQAGQHYISSLGKNVTLSSNVTKWSGVATQALQKTGQYSYDNLLLLLHQMQTESSGNQNAINNWDSNAKNGTPSKGLMQVIDPTFHTYAMSGYDKNIYDPLSNIIASIRYTTSRYGSLAKGWSGSGYAKGTTGTSKDEWALTDEFGPELTMYATPDGTLSFMRAGSTVVPAGITANLVEWGKLNPDMLNVNGTPNANMISNAINKPELNITFDSLIRAENITEETLPAVKKLVTQELNRFTKELNYALKGKGAR